MASLDTTDDLSTSRDAEWSALAAEFARFAEEWDQCAAGWGTRAARWCDGSFDARTGHAIEQAHWACEQTRQVAEWVRLLAREMLTLTSSS